MKRVFIIHGWDGSPEANWLPWMKTELEKKVYEVTTPAMPDTENPNKEAWVKHLVEVIGEPDEETYLVGHSIGCKAILRYLEALPPDKKVAGVLLVAGWIALTMWEGRTEEDTALINSWVNPPFDFNKIKKHADKFVALFSDNDPFVPLEKNVDTYRDELGAEIVIEKGAYHFTGEETGVMEFPIILSTFLELAHENPGHSN